MPFSNPIMGGQNFIRPVMSSPDFSISGQTGWAIYKDGNAYFYNLTVSGDIIITGTNGWFIYSGTPALGNDPIAYAVAPGVTADPFGNSLALSAAVVSVNGNAWTALQGGAMYSMGPHAAYSAGFFAASTEAAGIMGLDSGLATNTDTASALLVNSANNGTPAQVISGADANTYDMTRLTLFTTSNQTINSTSSTVITGLSCPVAANGLYRISGVIQWVQGSASVAQKMGFSGPATSNVRITANQQGIASATAGNWSSFTSLAIAATPAFNATSSNVWEFDGIVGFTAAGTFEVIAAEGTSGDTFSIESYSFMDVMPVA